MCENCKKQRNVVACSVCGKKTCDRCGLNVIHENGPWVCVGGGKCHFIARQPQLVKKNA